MVKQNGRQSFKSLLFVAFALIVLLACWDSNRTNAAVVTPSIPKESIRLRILANSDSPEDQLLKREIRDAIVARMEEWVTGPHTIEEARAVVREHLPEFDELVGRMIQERGYSYTHKVELGIVPFPTKMYGNEVYPAGDYEALRVTIGSGEGQNWWCVLFPPLCFVDSVSGEAVATTDVAAASVDGDKEKSVSAAADKGKAAKASASVQDHSDAGKAAVKKQAGDLQDQADAAEAGDSKQPQVKFFLWELLKKIGSWFS